VAAIPGNWGETAPQSATAIEYVAKVGSHQLTIGGNFFHGKGSRG
jgi:hypothetical protein